jgi:septation ring formation regulator EzrA
MNEEQIDELEELTRQMIEANKEQSITLSNLDKTLITVSNTMTTISNNQADMKLDIEGLQGDIKGLQEERNINIIQWLKDNWAKLGLIGIVAYEIIKNSIQ